VTVKCGRTLPKVQSTSFHVFDLSMNAVGCNETSVTLH